ncbi:MAG: 50S ribosomal protein L21 [Opitutales bacterium]
MKAIIQTQGSQFTVREGDILEVNQYVDKPASTFDENGVRLKASPRGEGEIITIDSVLSVGEGADMKIGSPFVEGATVEAKVVELLKGEKVIIFKKKRRQGYRRRKGHRQRLARIEITKINA